MTKKKYLISFDWIISKDGESSFEIGSSKVIFYSPSKLQAINLAIDFASNVPMIEIERNGIDLTKFMDGCHMTFRTRLFTIHYVALHNEDSDL